MNETLKLIISKRIPYWYDYGEKCSMFFEIISIEKVNDFNKTRCNKEEIILFCNSDNKILKIKSRFPQVDYEELLKKKYLGFK